MKKTVTMILMVLAATMVGAQDLAHYKLTFFCCQV